MQRNIKKFHFSFRLENITACVICIPLQYSLVEFKLGRFCASPHEVKNAKTNKIDANIFYACKASAGQVRRLFLK